MLPLSYKSWYLAIDEGANGLSLKKAGNGELYVQAALSTLANSKTQMLIAVLEASPTSSKYAVKVCGRFEAIDGIQTLPVFVYMIELNDQSYTKLSTNASFELGTSNACYDLSFDVSLAQGTDMKQDMLDGYAALVFDLTLPTALQSTIKTTAASKLYLDSLSLSTTCLQESTYSFPGWEGVPLDGYPPA